MTDEALYSKESFKNQPVDFRIGAIIADGMWYSLPKWRKFAKCTEEELRTWVDEHLASGELIQSETGAMSYRFPLKSIEKWYADHDLPVEARLVDFLFPPRIWDGVTEAEGFEDAPLRSVGIVTFVCDATVASEAIEALQGIARVRESQAGTYKAYGLNAQYIKAVVKEVFDRHPERSIEKVYTRASSKRREIVDFTPEFAKGLVTFYGDFARTLTKGSMETIKIFLPDPTDQESQRIMWVIAAIEKFDESASVPFSGYLNSVLKRRPYDLPSQFLGKELSNFQRERAKAVAALRERDEESAKRYGSREMAKAMGIDYASFVDLEEKHQSWIRSVHATTLTWGETADEKLATPIAASGEPAFLSTPSDRALASALSRAVNEAALSTGAFKDAMTVISQIDAPTIDAALLEGLDIGFVATLGANLGIGEG